MEDTFLPSRPILRLLKETGIEDWDPRVIYQLLEFQHGLIEELLDDAKEFAIHRGKHSLSEQDIRLAMLARNVKITTSKSTPFRLGLRKPELKPRSQPLPHIAPTDKVRIPKTRLLINDNFTIREEEEIPLVQSNQTGETSSEGNKNDKPNLSSAKYNVKASSKTIELVVPSTI